MTDTSNSVFYRGVTSNLKVRVYQHKSQVYPTSFTGRYKCDKLVYYTFYMRIEEAVSAEKQIKAGSRQNKIDLIKSINSDWRDLYFELLE